MKNNNSNPQSKIIRESPCDCLHQYTQNQYSSIFADKPAPVSLWIRAS